MRLYKVTIMARFWTSDLHFQHCNIVKYCDRPFKSVERMDDVLIKNINSRAKNDDTLIHLGDFMCYGGEKGVPGEKKKENHYLDKINSSVILIKGNHDKNNRVNSVADLLITQLGPYKVSASHYPSPINPENKLHIHLCGHVHNLWKHYYDKKNKILNINVGIDVWNYQIVSDQELITYIHKIKRELNV